MINFCQQPTEQYKQSCTSFKRVGY